MRSARSRISISQASAATDTVRDALNAHLRPHPVAMLSAEKVAGRFRRAPLGGAAALSLSHRQPPRPISRSSAAAPGGCRGGSTTTAMHEAAQRLIGKHDFTTFRSTECQAKSPEKTLDRLDVSRAGDEVHVSATARSFLHNQVRSMVGSLVQVGDGKWSADDLRRGAGRARPRRLRSGGAAGRALSGAGGLPERAWHVTASGAGDDHRHVQHGRALRAARWNDGRRRSDLGGRADAVGADQGLVGVAGIRRAAAQHAQRRTAAGGESPAGPGGPGSPFGPVGPAGPALPAGPVDPVSPFGPRACRTLWPCWAGFALRARQSCIAFRRLARPLRLSAGRSGISLRSRSALRPGSPTRSWRPRPTAASTRQPGGFGTRSAGARPPWPTDVAGVDRPLRLEAAGRRARGGCCPVQHACSRPRQTALVATSGDEPRCPETSSAVPLARYRVPSAAGHPAIVPNNCGVRKPDAAGLSRPTQRK